MSEWVFSTKVIYLILGLVIVVELGLGLKTLLTPLPQTASVQAVNDGRIVLSSEKTSFNIGEQVPVTVKLFTGGHTTVGTDLVIKYDPQKLELDSTLFQDGDAYQDYVGISSDSGEGLVLVSGIVLSDREGFNGVSEFGKINFKARANGQTAIKVVFTEGLTVDSNIIESSSAKDILGEVFDLDIAIGGQVDKAQSISNNDSCSGFNQLCFDEEGKQGTQFCERGKRINNSCNFDPSLTESCESCSSATL